MKKFIGLLLILIAISGGLYIGLWQCFIGGWVDVVKAFKADVFQASVLAWGIFKIIMAPFFGWLFGIVFGITGYTMVSD